MNASSSTTTHERVSKITTPVRNVTASALWRIGFEADRLSHRISGIEPIDLSLEGYADAVGRTFEGMREGAGLGVEQMAELLGVTEGYLRRVEVGHRDLDLERRFPVVLARHLRGVTS